MHIRATELAKILGISRHTVQDWCHRDASLAIKIKGVYHVRVEKLAERPGMDLVRAYLLVKTEQKWVSLAALSKLTGVSRRTLAAWAKNRPCFATRIGRNWYVSLETLTNDPEQLEILERRMGDLSHKPPFVGDLSRNEEEDS